MSREVNVVALVRGEEHYIFMFDETNRTEMLRTLGRYAADPQLSFTWYDAAVLSQRIREEMPAKTISTASLSLAPGKPATVESNRTPNHSPRFRMS